MTKKYLEFPAVCATHKNGRQIFSFPIDGVKIPKIANVSHYKREDNSEGEGFQRPEVKAHIATIAEYLKKPDAMIANAIVIAFNDSVSFSDEGNSTGILKVPVLEDDDKPGLIIDGQQRTKAIERAFSSDEGTRVGTFPMIVCAYIETDESALSASAMRAFIETRLPPSFLSRSTSNETCPSKFFIAGSLFGEKIRYSISGRNNCRSNKSARITSK